MSDVRSDIRENIVCRALVFLTSSPGATCKEIARGIHIPLGDFGPLHLGSLDHILGAACKKGTLRRSKLHNHTTNKKTWRYFIP